MERFGVVNVSITPSAIHLAQIALAPWVSFARPAIKDPLDRVDHHAIESRDCDIARIDLPRLVMVPWSD
jgi:hypothetical protein